MTRMRFVALAVLPSAFGERGRKVRTPRLLLGVELRDDDGTLTTGVKGAELIGERGEPAMEGGIFGVAGTGYGVDGTASGRNCDVGGCDNGVRNPLVKSGGLGTGGFPLALSLVAATEESETRLILAVTSCLESVWKVSAVRGTDGRRCDTARKVSTP